MTIELVKFVGFISDTYKLYEPCVIKLIGIVAVNEIEYTFWNRVTDCRPNE